MYLKVKWIAQAEPLTEGAQSFLNGLVKIRLFEDPEGIIEKIKGFSHIILVAYSKRSRSTVAYVAKVISKEGVEIKVRTNNIKKPTNILHIQPYHTADDCIYSASTPNDATKFSSTPKTVMLKSMLKEAEHFHGDLCAGVAIGVRMLYRAVSELGCYPRDRELKVIVSTKGCIADGIQAPMGATNKRFRAVEPIDDTATFTYKGCSVRVKLAQSTKFNNAEEVIEANEEEVISGVEVLKA
ncbi:MAG: formylmethanofuran dehydrogenase subunit E family protein [Nitrososphaerales archaeon]